MEPTTADRPPRHSDRATYQALIDRPHLTFPNGKRIAVVLYLNVEEWNIDKPMPRTVLPPPMGQPLLPDVPNWSWHEYGMRSGFWRHHKALTKRNIPATLCINGSVCTSYPRVAGAALDAGWEFMGHGFMQGPQHKLPDERAAIRQAVAAIEAFTGKRVRSWESPGLTETEQTLDLLAEAGVEYVADWVLDDLPVVLPTAHGSVTTVPYTVEVNDVAVYALGKFTGDEFRQRGCDQFDVLYEESATNARVMAISIHPYLTGVPHRVKYLEQLLDYIASHEGVWWATASEVGDWYTAEMRELMKRPRDEGGAE